MDSFASIEDNAGEMQGPQLTLLDVTLVQNKVVREFQIQAYVSSYVLFLNPSPCMR